MSFTSKNIEEQTSVESVVDAEEDVSTAGAVDANPWFQIHHKKRVLLGLGFVGLAFSVALVVAIVLSREDDASQSQNQNLPNPPLTTERPDQAPSSESECPSTSLDVSPGPSFAPSNFPSAQPSARPSTHPSTSAGPSLIPFPAKGGVRRGVGVIADFADAKLEQYTGSWEANAINTVLEFREILDDVQKHWEWMSLGKEEFLWDIVRISLIENLSPDAFSTWQGYRTAVGTRIVEAVNSSFYDLDKDGNIDAAFVIASNHGKNFPYLVGGASLNGGTNMFVDHQDSLSLRGRHIGNFNHEMAHLFGIQDLYGPYDNVKYLTLMSDTWSLPPNGFSAWERYKLGWLDLVEIRENSSEIVLRPSDMYMDAVMVPTDCAMEYFLLEYRKRPENGYGSAPSTDFNGLAIYHVWEGADNANRMLPPLICLETPDLVYKWNSPPGLTDFWFPENPLGSGVFKGKAYRHENSTLVEVHNLKWNTESPDDRIQFDVTIFDVLPPMRNDTSDPIKNGNFEVAGSDGPKEWTFGAWNTNRATFAQELKSGVGGSACAMIENNEPNDAWFEQTVTGLVIGAQYRVRGLIKVVSIEMEENSNIGASISRIGTWDRSEPVNKERDWTEVELMFTADAETTRIGCRLGYWASSVSGKILCDNFSIQWVPSCE